MDKPFNFVPIDLHAKNKNRERPVMAIYEDGRMCRFPSVRDAAKMMNVQAPNIVACLKGRLKKTGGYYWRYADE